MKVGRSELGIVGYLDCSLDSIEAVNKLHVLACNFSSSPSMFGLKDFFRGYLDTPLMGS